MPYETISTEIRDFAHEFSKIVAHALHRVSLAQGMFNLNDPRWGRGEDKGDDAHRPEDRGRCRPRGAGLVLVALVSLPDSDELWRDLNRRLSGYSSEAARGGPKGGGQPDMRSAGIGLALLGGVAFAVWMGSGFFIVKEKGSKL